MSSHLDRSNFRLGPWSILAGLSAIVLALVWMPPFLGPQARAVVMQGFHVVCHQLPERSLQIGEVPLAVCHRCLGIYIGFAAGVFAVPLALSRLIRLARYDRILLALSLVPLALDWTLGVTGVWANTPISRGLTGLLFGLTAGLIAGRGLAVGLPLSPASTEAELKPV